MSEVMKDSAIKLFGKTIPLPFADAAVSDVSLSQLRRTSCATSTSQDTKDESGGDEYDSMKQAEATSSEMSEDPETEKKDESSEEKTLVKKPDKIIPCPRCNSMETKFCYYNNYNVNQPRYFCKNCQRYWTSGGTMRNVPVGSGRRKTKHYQSLTNGADASSLKPSGFLVGHSVAFYPAALFWGGMGSAAARPCSVLGKHSREGKENLDAGTRVLIPKTLRIQDPSEAAKSSIWTTLGIRNDKLNGAAGSLFKALEPKGDRHPRVDRRAMVLQANPAALSRSLNFHESA